MKLSHLHESYYVGRKLPADVQELMDNFVDVFQDEDGYEVIAEAFNIPKPLPDGKEDWNKSKNIMHWFIQLKSEERANKLKAYFRTKKNLQVMPYDAKDTVSFIKVPAGWDKSLFNDKG